MKKSPRRSGEGSFHGRQWRCQAALRMVILYPMAAYLRSAAMSCIRLDGRLSRCLTARLDRDGHAASGPLQSKVMCLLEFPVRFHLKAKALTLSSVALP